MHKCVSNMYSSGLWGPRATNWRTDVAMQRAFIFAVICDEYNHEVCTLLPVHYDGIAYALSPPYIYTRQLSNMSIALVGCKD